MDFSNANDSKYFLITIDVEDWFQVENFKSKIPFQSWPSRQLRVEKNVHRLLGLLDTANGQRTTDNGRQPKLQATFFVLGWIAERVPKLVREIHHRGHEVASHGFNHQLCNLQSRQELEEDLIKSKQILEDIIGEEVNGYRAPGFSINSQVLSLVKSAGYHYDSSYNSFNLNPRYGEISLKGCKKNGISHQVAPNFFELPISNLELKNKGLKAPWAGRTLPWGGGGYFRLIPWLIFRPGVRTVLQQNDAYLFYMHPWEVDPQQPKVTEVSAFYKLRHYVNLNKTHAKLDRMITSFRHCEFITCKSYLAKSQSGKSHRKPFSPKLKAT